MKAFYLALASVVLPAILTAPVLADPSSATPPKAGSKALPPDVSPSNPAAPAVDGMLKTDIMKRQADGNFHGSQPVTRYELAVVLNRFINYIEQSNKPIKQSMFPVPLSSITAKAGTPGYDAQVHLLRYGFVSVSSPLLKRPATGVVTAQDLADVMSTVTARISDRELPVTKNAGPTD